MRRKRERGRPQASKRARAFQVRENNRHGTDRDPVASTVSTGDSTAPLESRRQRRALRGPRQRHTAATSTVRDAWATPVQILKPANAPKGTRRTKHRDPEGMTFTLDLGGSTPCEYVYGTG